MQKYRVFLPEIPMMVFWSLSFSFVYISLSQFPFECVIFNNLLENIWSEVIHDWWSDFIGIKYVSTYKFWEVQNILELLGWKSKSWMKRSLSWKLSGVTNGCDQNLKEPRALTSSKEREDKVGSLSARYLWPTLN